MSDAAVFTHAKVSTKSDTADAALVQPSDWNDTHAVSGGNTGGVLVRDSAAADGASVTAAGTFGQVFTSNGAGALPTFKDAPSTLVMALMFGR